VVFQIRTCWRIYKF